MKTRIRKNNRLKNYDYTQNGWYFVTICPKFKKEWFGSLQSNEIKYNDIGLILEKQWKWLEEHFKQVSIRDYVIMPNHFHGILSISNNVTGQDLSLQKNVSLSQIIGAFKTTTSKQIHLSGNTSFQWQRSFYERIIRNEQDYLRIKRYIFNNPEVWYIENRDKKLS